MNKVVVGVVKLVEGETRNGVREGRTQKEREGDALKGREGKKQKKRRGKIKKGRQRRDEINASPRGSRRQIWREGIARGSV